MDRLNRMFTGLVLVALLLSACQPIIQPPTYTARRNVELLGHVGGAAGTIAVQGDYAYLGFSQEWMVLDIQDRSQPRWVTALAIPANDTALVEQMAYVVGRTGLAVIDVADPRQPREIGFLPSSGTLTHINVVGRYAYFTGTRELYVADVTTPVAPKVVGKLYIGSNLQDLCVVGPYAYLTTTNGFYVVHIADPAQPAVTAALPILGIARGLAVADSLAYFANSDENGERLQVVDLHDPSQPAIIAQFNLTGWVSALYLADSYLYVANGRGGIEVWQLDKMLPGSLAKVGAVDVASEHSITLDLTGQDDHLFLVDMDEGVQIFDISDPAQLVELGSFTPLGCAMDCVVTNDVAYVTAGWNRNLHGLQVADASQVHEIDWHLFAGTVCDLAITGKLAYLLDCNGRVLVLDITDATQPRQISVIEAAGFDGLTVVETHLYLSNFAGALWVVDVSDPTHPHGVKIYLELGYTNRLAAADGLAYLPSDEVGMRILAIGERGTLTQVGVYPLAETVYKIAVAGRYAYLALGAAGVQIVDVSNPTTPRLVSSLVLPGEAVDLVIAGDYLLIAAGEAGLRVLDVRNPAHPQEAGFYETPDYARSVTLADGVIYVADNLSGLYMLAFPPLQKE
jgi:hypothetical protein